MVMAPLPCFLLPGGLNSVTVSSQLAWALLLCPDRNCGWMKSISSTDSPGPWTGRPEDYVFKS
jgi:hypothetical protein